MPVNTSTQVVSVARLSPDLIGVKGLSQTTTTTTTTTSTTTRAQVHLNAPVSSSSVIKTGTDSLVSNDDSNDDDMEETEIIGMPAMYIHVCARGCVHG